MSEVEIEAIGRIVTALIHGGKFQAIDTGAVAAQILHSAKRVLSALDYTRPAVLPPAPPGETRK